MGPPRAIAALACLAGVLVSCSSSAPPPPPVRASPPPGVLVSVTSDQTASSLVRYGLADASSADLESPIDPEAVNRGTVASTTTADGTLFIAANSRSLQAYSLPTGATTVTELGPPLDVRADQDPSVQISEAGAVVTTCDAAYVLPLPAADRWIPIPPTCWAALDPIGTHVAFASTGGHVLMARLGSDATPELMFDLSDLADSLGTHAPPRLVGVPSWGPQGGLAFFVRAGDQLGVFVRDAFENTEVLQERYANVYRVPRLAWQPGGGPLLAISDDAGPFPAVLRTFDTQTGELRALSMFPVGYAGIHWAPDGTSLAVLTGTGVLIVVDLHGDWLVHRQTDWKELLGWDAAS